MTHNDREMPVTRGRLSCFRDLLARLRAGSHAEELALVSGGWREEVARIRRRHSGCGCAFFGLVVAFFLAGCLFLVILVWALRLDWRANNRYLPNSCVVLDRRLATQMSNVLTEEGAPGSVQRPTYHPEIKIQYEVGGRKYEVWTYETIAMFSPDRAAQQAIVDSFRVGATYPCWYDPDRPDRAILVQGYAWGAYVVLIGLIVLLVLGGAGIRHLWKDGGIRQLWRNRGKPAYQLGFERAPLAGGTTLAADPDRPTLPTLDLSQSPGSTLRYRLPSRTRPGRNVLGCLFLVLFSNGITAPLVIVMIASRLGPNWAKPGPPWPVEIVVILCALADLAALVFFVYFALAELLVAIGVGPTTVEVSHHPLEPGTHVEVFIAQRARRTLNMNRLRAICVCEEEATCRAGGGARTETRRVYEEEILAREQFELGSSLPLEARAELWLPRRAMHSFLAAHNQVRWKLVVRGDVAGWPDFEREFPIVVHPSKGAPE
jgi:hypothetical protein